MNISGLDWQLLLTGIIVILAVAVMFRKISNQVSTRKVTACDGCPVDCSQRDISGQIN